MLTKENIDFAIPDLPGERHPKSAEWLSIIDQEAKKSDKPIILVGHSLGTRTALLYLDQFGPENIDSVLLVAAFNNNCEQNCNRRHEAYPDFWEYPVDIDKIKKLVKQFVVMHSKDDSSIDYAQAVEISQELDAKLLTYQNRDHFTEADNAAEIFKVLQSLL
jgi:predicted alpha/beta hydrolase family esterase